MLPLTPTDRVSDKIHCKILSYDPYERNKGFKVAVYTSDGTAYSSVPENSLSFISPSQNFGFTYPYLTGLDDGKGGEGQPPPTPNPPPKLSKELNEILMYVQSIYQRQLYMEQDIGEQRHNQLSLEKKIMNKLHEIKLAVQSVESSFNTNMNPPTNPDEDFIPEPKPQVPFQQVEESSTVKDLTAGPTVPWIGAEPKWGFAQLKQYVPDQLELQEETEGVSPTALRPRPGKPDYNPPPPKPDREPRPRPKPRPQN